MNIYRVEFEVDTFQSLLAADDSVHERKLLALAGEPKKDSWGGSLAAEIDNSAAAVPDIFSLGSGNMLVYGKSLEILNQHLDCEYELLPVHWGNSMGYCINLLAQQDCIDEDNSIWCTDDESGKNLFLDEYAFKKENIPEEIMFKDSLDPYEIFTTDKKGSLKDIVETHQLKGISFELLWSS